MFNVRAMLFGRDLSDAEIEKRLEDLHRSMANLDVTAQFAAEAMGRMVDAVRTKPLQTSQDVV